MNHIMGKIAPTYGNENGVHYEWLYCIVYCVYVAVLHVWVMCTMIMLYVVFSRFNGTTYYAVIPNISHIYICICYYFVVFCCVVCPVCHVALVKLRF